MDSHAHKFQLLEEDPAECTCYHAPELHSAGGCGMLGCACKWDGKLRAEEPRDTQPAPPRLDYDVQHGFFLARTESFATFAEARAFVKGLLAGSPYAKTEWRVVNRARHDGDSKHGLTEDEREELEAL